jgi:agmatine deiminase
VFDDRTEAPAYPKPMVPATSASGRSAPWYDYYTQMRMSNSEVFGITASPATSIVAPAEFADKRGLALAWTGEMGDVVADIVREASAVTQILVVHDGDVARRDFERQMAHHGVSTAGVSYFDMPNESMWMRDFGPLSVVDPTSQKIGFVDLRYYPERIYDDAVPTQLANLWNLNVFRMPLNFEGGNFISDGLGTCYATTAIGWTNQASETQIRRYFRDYLGCAQLILVHPMDGEGTGHIDMFAKLLTPDTMVVGSYTSAQDSANRILLDQNAQILSQVTLTDGRPLNVVRIPMPGNWDRVYRSYTNSQLINGVHLIPVYADDREHELDAVNIYKSLLPGWRHVTVDATELITWAGAVHCIVMELGDGNWSRFQSAPASLCTNPYCAPTSTGGNTGCGDVPVSGECVAGDARRCSFGEVEARSCTGTCGWDGRLGRTSCNGTPSSPAQPTDPTPPPTGCGDIGGIGCCDGSVLRYCTESQTVATQSCTSGCGWNPSGNGGAGWYDCGYSSSDPSGQNPLSCAGECVPSCAGRECGDDGCGGSCGSCTTGSTCENGACVADQFEPPSYGCGRISGVGCCDGTTLYYCNQSHQLSVESCGSCGWNPAGFDGHGWYDCGYGGTDPTGNNPLSCGSL